MSRNQRRRGVLLTITLIERIAHELQRAARALTSKLLVGPRAGSSMRLLGGTKGLAGPFGITGGTSHNRELSRAMP